MPRGEATQNKIHYKGEDDDFVVFVDDVSTYRKWKSDPSVPMAHFISSFQIFVTHRQGAQGSLNAAPNSVLDNEFGTHVVEEALAQILQKGSLQEVEGPERQGSKNDSQGGRVAH